MVGLTVGYESSLLSLAQAAVKQGGYNKKWMYPLIAGWTAIESDYITLGIIKFQISLGWYNQDNHSTARVGDYN